MLWFEDDLMDDALWIFNAWLLKYVKKIYMQ